MAKIFSYFLTTLLMTKINGNLSIYLNSLYFCFLNNSKHRFAKKSAQLSTMKKKITCIIPYLLTLIILTYYWINVIAGNSAPTVKHYLALELVLVNGILYVKKYTWAVLFTGAILLCATFNLLTFYIATQTAGMRIGSIQLPEIQYWSLLLLFCYGCINFNFLTDRYLDYKEAKEKRKSTR